MLAARSLGVATHADLADYHRLNIPASRHLMSELVASGALEQVEVEGWGQPAYLHPEARIPRKVQARTLLSPFDSLVWNRDRDERLWDFLYRIEIYVPKPKRVYGYYVLPFLLGEDLVGRVDVKADRKRGVLMVPGAFTEHHADVNVVSPHLAAELRLMADWLGLPDIEVGDHGDLARPLAQALATGSLADAPQ